jgi:hypothetical protein
MKYLMLNIKLTEEFSEESNHVAGITTFLRNQCFLQNHWRFPARHLAFIKYCILVILNTRLFGNLRQILITALVNTDRTSGQSSGLMTSYGSNVDFARSILDKNLRLPSSTDLSELSNQDSNESDLRKSDHPLCTKGAWHFSSHKPPRLIESIAYYRSFHSSADFICPFSSQGRSRYWNWLIGDTPFKSRLVPVDSHYLGSSINTPKIDQLFQEFDRQR